MEYSFIFVCVVGLSVCLAEWLIRLQLHTWRMRDISMITHSPRWPANSSKHSSFIGSTESAANTFPGQKPKTGQKLWPGTVGARAVARTTDRRTNGQLDKRTGGQFRTLFAQYVLFLSFWSTRLRLSCPTKNNK